MNYVNQVLMNFISQSKPTLILAIVIITGALIVILFATHRGSMTKVIICVVSGVGAVIVVNILPDLLQGAASDGPGVTGISSRY